MAKSQKNYIQRARRIVIFLFLLLVFGFILSLFAYSTLLKTKADNLVKQNQPQTAVFLYQQAKSLFPVRWDISGPLQYAKTLIAIQMQSEETTQSLFSGPYNVLPIPTHIPVHLPLFFRKPTPTPILAPAKIIVPILMYHHVEANPQPNNTFWSTLFITPQALNKQLSYLVTNGYHSVTLDEVYSALEGNSVLPSKPIVLTFDDGYRSFYDHAFPLFSYYHIRATEFIITNYVIQRYAAYLTPEQILQMDQTGLISFEAHTMDHPDLTRLSSSYATQEIKGSKDYLEFLLKKPVHWFAYPYGAYNTVVTKNVQNEGFEGAVSTILGNTQTMQTVFLMPRIAVDGTWDAKTFGKHIQQ